MWEFVLWFLAGSNAKAVPGGHLRDFLLAWSPMIAAGIARRLTTGERLFVWETPGTLTLFSDVAVQEIKARSVVLPGSEPDKPRSRGAAFFQMVTAISLLAPIGIALWRFGFGDPSNIKWMELTANAKAFALMLPAWRLLKDFDAVTTEIMRQSVQTMRSAANIVDFAD